MPGSSYYNIGEKVATLNHEDALKAGRKIQQITQALEDVEQFHQIGGNLHVKQFLEETRTFLRHMVRTANVKEEVMIMITAVCDLSYGWDCDGDTNVDFSAGQRSPPRETYGMNHFDRYGECVGGSTSWSLAVPNGAYQVAVDFAQAGCAGKSNFAISLQVLNLLPEVCLLFSSQVAVIWVLAGAIEHGP